MTFGLQWKFAQISLCLNHISGVISRLHLFQHPHLPMHSGFVYIWVQLKVIVYKVNFWSEAC